MKTTIILMLFLSACTSRKNRTTSPAKNLYSQSTDATGFPFLVVFDGLGLDRKSTVPPKIEGTTHSVMKELHQEWSHLDSRLYFISGNSPVSLQEAERLYQSHISLICRRIAVLNRPLQFFVAGYSRGAMMAVRLTQDLATGRCQSRHQYTTIWLGLLDTVSFGLTTMFGKWPTEAPAKAHTIHVRTKFENRETEDKFYFRTERIANTDYDHVFTPPAIEGRPGPHNSFGFSRQAKQILQSSISRWLKGTHLPSENTHGLSEPHNEVH